MREKAQASNLILALVAAARVAVGAAMILAPSRIFSPGSGAETLLMRTIGIRDVVLGSGACAAWARERSAAMAITPKQTAPAKRARHEIRAAINGSQLAP